MRFKLLCFLIPPKVAFVITLRYLAISISDIPWVSWHFHSRSRGRKQLCWEWACSLGSQSPVISLLLGPILEKGFLVQRQTWRGVKIIPRSQEMSVPDLFLPLSITDRSYQLFQYPSQSYEEINSFFSLWLVSKGSLESKVLGSPRIPAGRPELQLGLRKNSIWGLTCLQNLAHRSSAPLSGCWCHCLPLQTTFIYIIGPVATKHLPRFILHRFCLYF